MSNQPTQLQAVQIGYAAVMDRIMMLMAACGLTAGTLVGCSAQPTREPVEAVPERPIAGDGAEVASSPDSRGETARAAERAIAPGRYGGEAGAFVAARETLRELGFILDRVDANGGEITTVAKHTAGFVTPWDQEQSTIAQEVDDFLHRHQRLARVSFTPRGISADAADHIDLRAFAGEVVMRVDVVVERVHLPGKRVDVNAIRFTSYTIDPELVARGMQPRYEVPLKQDNRLAEWIATRVEKKLGAG